MSVPLSTIDALWYARAAMGEWVSTRYWITNAEGVEGLRCYGALAYRLIPLGEAADLSNSGAWMTYPAIVESLPLLVKGHFERRRDGLDSRIPWMSSLTPIEIIDLCRHCLADLGNPPNPEWVPSTGVKLDGAQMVERLDAWLDARAKLGGIDAPNSPEGQALTRAKHELVKALEGRG